MTLSAATTQKALRIQREGRVAEIAAPRAFEVLGDQGDMYVVVVSATRISCTCPYRGEACKHIAAAGIQIKGEA